MITTAVSLFDGIGGFPLALSRAGIQTVATVEIDAACRGVTERNLPPHKQFTDIKEVTGADLFGAGFRPWSGILTAGWPCQGNSVAGRRQGLADGRSGLWWEVARLVAELRPRWFVGENVPGLLTVNRGADFYEVVKSLEELGYGLAWRVLDAQYFGVPQRRKRVFLVASLGDPAGPAEVLFEPEGSGGDSPEGGEAGASASGAVAVGTLQGGGRRGYRVDAEGAAGGHLIPVTVGTLDAHEGPHGHGGPNVQSAFAGHYLPAPAYTLTSHHGRNDLEGNWLPSRSGVRRLTPREWERLQGFPDDWTAGQSDSARYRQCGNAVPVPVVEWVMRRIAGLVSTRNREAA